MHKRLSTIASGILPAIIALSSVGFAHDGHNHGNTGSNRSKFGETEYVPSRFTRDQVSGPPPRTLVPRPSTRGACCHTSSACPLPGDAYGSPRGDLSRLSAVSQSDPRRLEQLGNRLATELSVELRRSRNYDNLMDDADAIVRATRRVRQADAARAPANTLLNEARRIVPPLRRVHAELVNDRRADGSYETTRELASVLVAWARNLPTESTNAAPRPRGNDSIESPRPRIPSQSRGVRIPEEMKGVALLPADEQALALRQRICPVTDEPLGSMGKPIRVTVGNRSMFVCCEGCVNAVKRNPQRYFSALPGNSEGTTHLQNRRPSSRDRESTASIPEDMKGVALLPASEQAAALRQRTCPVTREPLGSMGKPIKVRVAGQTVFVCCQGCVNALQRNPEKYRS